MGLIGPPDDWYTQFRAAGDQLLEYQKQMARFWADLEQAYLLRGGLQGSGGHGGRERGRPSPGEVGTVNRVEAFLAARIDCDGCGRKMREEFAWHRGRERLCGTCENLARLNNKNRGR